jgi:dephospho-CoA kinase
VAPEGSDPDVTRLSGGRRSGPLAVAITGGIGAGKSTLLAALRANGAATVSSDEIVHNLLAHDDDVREALVEKMGPGVLGEDGRPDRRKIAERVFGNRPLLEWLEGLLHPLVSREYLGWREQLVALDDPPAVCVTEVPLLYEVGAEDRFDKVVVVTAPKQLREQRRRVPLDTRDDRLLPDREKVRRADYHFVNTGDFEEIDRFAIELLAELEAESAAG